jgi:hypothetical protein
LKGFLIFLIFLKYIYIYNPRPAWTVGVNYNSSPTVHPVNREEEEEEEEEKGKEG